MNYKKLKPYLNKSLNYLNILNLILFVTILIIFMVSYEFDNKTILPASLGIATLILNNTITTFFLKNTKSLLDVVFISIIYKFVIFLPQMFIIMTLESKFSDSYFYWDIMTRFVIEPLVFITYIVILFKLVYCCYVYADKHYCEKATIKIVGKSGDGLSNAR